MAHYSYALYATTFEPETAEEVFKDIGLQYNLAWKHCQDNTTGLLRHGYDYSKRQVWADPVTGASPEVWDRVRSTHFTQTISGFKENLLMMYTIGFRLVHHVPNRPPLTLLSPPTHARHFNPPPPPTPHSHPRDPAKLRSHDWCLVPSYVTTRHSKRELHRKLRNSNVHLYPA